MNTNEMFDNIENLESSFELEDLDTFKIDDSNDDYESNEIDEDEDAVSAFELLKKVQLFDEEDEQNFTKSWDSFTERIEELPNKIINKVIDSAPDKFKDLLYLVHKNPSDEEIENILNAYRQDNNYIEDFDSDTAREYLENVYTKQGMKPKAVKSALDALEDDDELIDEAKNHYEKNRSKELETLRKQQEALEKQQEAERKQFVSELDSSFKTLGWKDTRITEVKKTLNNFNDITSKIASNPKSLIQLADFISKYNDKTGEFDLTTYVKMANSQEVNKVKDNIYKDAFGKKTKASHEKQDNNFEFKPIE